MRDVDNNAVSAKTDKRFLESFIKNNEAFIINTAFKATGRYITKSDDLWSISLSAFYEAVQNYSYEKGSFFSFCELIIKRRIIDYRKNQSKYNNEISIDPFTFESGSYENDDEAEISREVVAKLSYNPDNSIKLEIETITATLKNYGISFFDLTNVSPKAEKTKSACAKAIVFVIKNPILLNDMRISKMLAIKFIEKNTGVPRKILERHRKYIIAGIEIISGDYPNLAEYLKFIREDL